MKKINLKDLVSNVIFVAAVIGFLILIWDINELLGFITVMTVIAIFMIDVLNWICRKLDERKEKKMLKRRGQR